jgi:exopolyphosphatase/guanosine-5'-triphosphate,3'-diphosphate pyrophosphatase
MTRVAAVDIGTNSTRLLVADLDGAGRDGRLTQVDRRTRITRLGQGVNDSRALHPDAITRTLAVLREYREAIDELGVARVRATATSASRDATNRDDFFDPAEATLGVRPELISGDDEARLEFTGATAGLEEPSPFLVLDVGGGSTEFICGGDEPDGLVSIDVGCVRLTEQYRIPIRPRPRSSAKRCRSCVTTLPTSTASCPVPRPRRRSSGRPERCGRWARSSWGSMPRRATASTTSVSPVPPPKRSSGRSRPNRSPAGATIRGSRKDGST